MLYGLRLNRPETGKLEDGKWLYSYDENYTVLTARRIAEGDKNVWDAWKHPDDHQDRLFTMRFASKDLGNDDSRYEWVHPPTPRMVMSAIIRVAGMNPVAYRMPSVWLGVLIVAMTWVIGNRMRGPSFGLFAGTLAATDGWLFCLSRVAMTDIYFIGMTVTAYALFYVWWTARSHRTWWMIADGLVCGAALAMKWSAAGPVFGLAVLAMARFLLDWRRSPTTRFSTLRDAAVALAAFTLVPAAVYVLSFWPFFAAGHTATEWFAMHRAIFDYNRRAPATAPGSSAWYEWPLDRRATWFLTRAKNGFCQYTFASSNWFVWWPFIPAVAYATLRFIYAALPVPAKSLSSRGYSAATQRLSAFFPQLAGSPIAGTLPSAVDEPRFEQAFLVVATSVMWLPYALIHRFVFTRYFTLLVPFGALAIAMALFDLRSRWPRVGEAVCFAYMAGALAFFVVHYPAWAGVPLPCKGVEAGQWDYWFRMAR